MKYAIFSPEGNLKFVVTELDLDKINFNTGNFSVEVSDDFEMFGYITSYVDGQIVQVEEDLSLLPGPAEVDLENLRRERNNLLKVTDWTQFPDIPEATRNAWQPYRQALIVHSLSIVLVLYRMYFQTIFHLESYPP